MTQTLRRQLSSRLHMGTTHALSFGPRANSTSFQRPQKVIAQGSITAHVNSILRITAARNLPGSKSCAHNTQGKRRIERVKSALASSQRILSRNTVAILICIGRLIHLWEDCPED